MESIETSEETIQRLLSAYDVGRKLRQLRLRKKISLVDLGKHTGLSASMLSQLETGKLQPTLPTLVRIAMVFDVSLDHFFSKKRKRGMIETVRADERMKFPESAETKLPNFFFECLNFSATEKSIHAYIAEFPRIERKSVLDHFHGGEELVHVLEGSLAIKYVDDEVVLSQGDTVYFDASELHGYRGLSKRPARALVVTAPPR